jgi:hypothetical protein
MPLCALDYSIQTLLRKEVRTYLDPLTGAKEKVHLLIP